MPEILKLGVGSYKLVVDLNKSIIAMTPFRFGIVGSATPNGWATPDTKMTLNNTTGIWEATLALTSGEMKFRANDARILIMEVQEEMQ